MKSSKGLWKRRRTNTRQVTCVIANRHPHSFLPSSAVAALLCMLNHGKTCGHRYLCETPLLPAALFAVASSDAPPAASCGSPASSTFDRSASLLVPLQGTPPTEPMQHVTRVQGTRLCSLRRTLRSTVSRHRRVLRYIELNSRSGTLVGAEQFGEACVGAAQLGDTTVSLCAVVCSGNLSQCKIFRS